MEVASLTELQLAVMKALWRIREGTVADVLAAMTTEGRVLAPTTVATLLQRLSKQGWVQHRKSGRQFLYRAKIDERQAAQGVLQRLLKSFFHGKVSALTAHLVESEQISREDLEQMRALLNKKGD